MPVGYLLILLCCLLMCGMAVSRKAYQRSVDATLVTTVTFMGVCSLSICLIGVICGIFTDFAMICQMDRFVLGIGIAFAVILTVNTCLCIFGAKYGSLAMVLAFANLGTLVISAVYGLISDPERNRLSVFKGIGSVLVMMILVISFLEEKRSPKDGKDRKAQKDKRIFVGICLLIFLFNGSALPIYSAFSTYRGDFGSFNFIFVYMFFCVILCGMTLTALGLLCLRNHCTVKPEVKKCLSRKPLCCTLVYSCLFLFSEYCSIRATGMIPIVVQAPLCFSVEVILSAIADFVLYGQKMTKMQLVQMVLAVAGGVLFAVG